MSTRESLAFAIRTVLRPRNVFMLLCLLLVNLLVALAVAFPFYRRMEDALARHPDSESLFAGLTMSFLVDFRALNGEYLEDLTFTVGGAVFLTVLLNVFFAGGLVAVFHSEDRTFHFPKFFAGSGTYFLRFLRLAILSFAALFGLAQAKARFLDPYVERLRAAATSDWTALLHEWWPAILVLVLTSFVVLVADYAKVRTVVEGRRSALFAFFSALGLVLGNPRRTVGLFIAIALLEAFALAVFTAVQRFAGDVRSGAALLASVVLSQALVTTRLGFRALHFAGEVVTVKDLLGVPVDRGRATAEDVGLSPQAAAYGGAPGRGAGTPTLRVHEPEITELPPIDVPAPSPAAGSESRAGDGSELGHR